MKAARRSLCTSALLCHVRMQISVPGTGSAWNLPWAWTRAKMRAAGCLAQLQYVAGADSASTAIRFGRALATEFALCHGLACIEPLQLWCIDSLGSVDASLCRALVGTGLDMAGLYGPECADLHDVLAGQMGGAKGQWRTPEKTLQMLALAGGWPGAVLAQQWLRHKSSKTRFQLQFWCMALLNAVLIFWLLSPYGGICWFEVFASNH